MSVVLEGPELSAYQISATYLNPRPRYYYFRFLKTNGRHLEIRVSVAAPISSKSDHLRQSYDVIAIFKMAAVSHVGFGLGQW